MHRAALVAALAGAAVFGAAAGLGWADMPRTLDLLSGTAVTTATGFALVATVCWLGAAVIIGAVVAGLFGDAAGVRRPLRPAALVLLAGTVILALGVTHHDSGYSVCCANPATVEQAQTHVR